MSTLLSKYNIVLWKILPRLTNPYLYMHPKHTLGVFSIVWRLLPVSPTACKIHDRTMKPCFYNRMR